MTDHNFTVIRLSGRTEYYPDTDYFSVLSIISREYGSAGGNWDRPNILLKNGKIVVPEGIADIAWRYQRRYRELLDEMDAKVKQEFAPDWLETSHDQH